MQFFLRLAITAFIITMFFMANHVSGPMTEQVFRIFGTIGIFQITVMYHLWRTNARQIQSQIDKGKITNEFNRKEIYLSGAISFAIALGYSAILYLPNIIALGWVWILSYVIGFYAVFVTLGKYFQLRNEVNDLRKTAQLMLDNSNKKRNPKSKRK